MIDGDGDSCKNIDFKNVGALDNVSQLNWQ